MGVQGRDGAADLSAVREERLLGPDGTDLAVQELGEGRLVVVVNGLGGSLRAWAPFLGRFGPGHRVVSFDYRGLYRSGPPPVPDAVTIRDHAADLLAVLRWAGPEPAVVIAWSMGVQVAVEAALPRAFIDADPFFASVFVTNLGSVGIDAGFHHLYEYGTMPLFCAFGLVQDGIVARDGKPVVTRVASLKFSYDERVEDGLYAAKALKFLCSVLEDPASA